MNTRKLRIAIEISQSGRVKRGVMEGIAHLNSGFLSVSLNKASFNFTPAECTLSSAFTLTGCPIAALTEKDGVNPWKETGGEYLSSRTLSAEKFKVSSTLESKALNNLISMNLRLELTGALPNLSSVKKPFQENILQKDTGIFHGSFEIEFLSEQNETIKAYASSDYSLKAKEKYPPVWRNIVIIDSHLPLQFNQVEQIDLYSEQESANADLQEKIHNYLN